MNSSKPLALASSLSNVPGSFLSIRSARGTAMTATAPERKPVMGLSWQQGPLAPGAIGRFLVPGLLPQRLLYAEPLRRRMRVRFGGAWVADSEDVVLLHEPGRYPVAYFPLADIAGGVLEAGEHTTRHRDLGPTSWYTV